MAVVIESPRRRGRLRIAVLVAVAAAFLALLVFGLVKKAPETGIDEALAQGRTPIPPAFELPVLDAGEVELPGDVEAAFADGTVALEELRGTPVVLNFWASWCAPCRDEAPLLENAWRSARGEGVLVLGLNQQDLTGDAGEFIDEFGLSYPNVRDESNDVALDWGVTGLPETYFISAEGEVTAHVVGTVSEAQLESGIAAARGGEPLGSLDGGEQRPAE
ncbi:MAG TPA: TlpA disulfide reductase family protein [Thermoleophilaceae bacterium]|nr:TlpA disulfide reductase family protein [Thermoleophilaceae bacterium]